MSTTRKTASRKTAEIIEPPTGPPPLLIFRPTLPPSKPPPLPSKEDRKKNKIEYIYDYSHEDLNGIDFSGLNGDNKYFASMSREDDAIVYGPFKGSTANFEGSNLTEANFSDSELAFVKFIGATLNGANFSHSQLDYVKFDDANLNVANFSYSQVLETKFIGAIADNIIFEDATIRGSDFSNAQLQRANFKNVYFKQGSDNTSFSRADLTDADFSRNEDEVRERIIAYYEDDIKRLEAMAALPTTTAAKKKTIKDTINSRDYVIESERGTKGFNRAPIDDHYEYSGDFGFKHKSTDSVMMISSVNFSNANLTRTNFSGCKFKQVNFMRANLTGTNFTGADLSGASFQGALNLDQAIFDGAINIPPFLKKELDRIQDMAASEMVSEVAEHKNLPPDMEQMIKSYIVGEPKKATPTYEQMERNTKKFNKGGKKTKRKRTKRKGTKRRYK